MPQVRIENMLRQVDRWTGLTRALIPLGGYEPRSGEDAYRTLLAALILASRPCRAASRT
jgi:hypothetical protein